MQVEEHERIRSAVSERVQDKTRLEHVDLARQPEVQPA